MLYKKKINSFKLQPLIISGMHRSGTSLLAKLFDQAGVSMGNQLQGDYESRLFRMLNDAALEIIHTPWDYPLLSQDVTEQTWDNLSQFIRKRLLRTTDLILHYPKLLWSSQLIKTTWGWKEPRNLILHPLWNRLFPEAKWILIKRNPLDVAFSLYTRERRREKEAFFFRAKKLILRQKILTNAYSFSRRCNTDRKSVV